MKILDFGIATLDDAVGFSQGGRDVTEPHAIVGTAGYLSPEQIRRETADARSDIFALGCVALRDGHGAARRSPARPRRRPSSRRCAASPAIPPTS